VEDEAKVARSIETSLVREGLSVSVAGTGEEGYFLATTQSFDLIILDIMLPGRSGFQILETLRSQRLEIPVLILTAKDTIEDRVFGLDLGADDYLVKPFAMPELMARIRALLRRGKPQPQAHYQIEDLELDCLERKVQRAGVAIDLTAKEFDILEYLFRHHGNIVSREMMVTDLWGAKQRSESLDNVIDVHLARLRSKVDAPFGTRSIETIRGVGFRLRKDQHVE